MGWTVYEEYRNDVERLCKDEDEVVRFNALHVRDDAALMELLADKKERALDAEARRAERARAKRDARRRREAAAAKRGRRP